MIVSNHDEFNEYQLLREPEHIAKMWAVMEASLPKYWEMFLQEAKENTNAAKLAKTLGGSLKQKDRDVINSVFEEAIKSFEKSAVKYREFFEPDAMEERRVDPNEFKKSLGKDVPVIANSLRSRNAELQDWQKSFRIAKPNDLLEVFTNILDFKLDWDESHLPSDYSDYDDPDVFELDDLDDEDFKITKVVGMGIKSIILFHLEPERFPQRGKNGLYGLYFLSGRKYFNLPSKSSEFLMINDLYPGPDGSIVMSNNYWYPYSVFSLYALRIYRWIEQRSKASGFTLDRALRYVYVQRLFDAVCDQHAEDLKTMQAHERFEFPS